MQHHLGPLVCVLYLFRLPCHISEAFMAKGIMQKKTPRMWVLMPAHLCILGVERFIKDGSRTNKECLTKNVLRISLFSFVSQNSCIYVQVCVLFGILRIFTGSVVNVALFVRKETVFIGLKKNLLPLTFS